MWTEDLPNGKYKYVERYKDPLTGKRQKVSLTHTKKNNRVEKEMFIKLQEKIESITQQSTIDISFEKLSEKWLNVYRKQVKVTSFHTDKNTVDFINKTIGKYTMDKVTPQMINTFLLGELERGNSYRFVSKKKSLIIRVLRFGLQYGYVSDSSILEKITIPKINLPKKDDFKFLERNELEELLHKLKERGYVQEARLCHIQTLTGMRYGELVGLDYKKQVDFEKKLIHIDRTYHQNTKLFTLPKGNKKRTIHVNDLTLKLIREQITFKQLQTLQHNLDRSTNLLFMSTYDNPYSIIRMNELLHEFELDSEKNLTTHIFRHTFISFMVEAGISTKLIAEHVGHADTKMIDQVYSHFTNLMNTRLKEAIESVEII